MSVSQLVLPQHKVFKDAMFEVCGCIDIEGDTNVHRLTDELIPTKIDRQQR